MKRFVLILALLGLLCMAGSVANAKAIYTVVRTASMSTDWTDLNATLSVAQFDPALGTLNSVTFDVSSLFTSTLSAWKTVNTAQYVKWAVGDPTMDLSTSDGSSLISSTGWLEFVGTKDAPAAVSNYVPIPKLPAVYSKTKTITLGGSYFLDSGLSAYIGNGVVPFSFSAAVPNLNVRTQGGNNIASISTSASADLTVTYEYSPVPEPGTVVAAILLLTPAGLMLRRRRA